MRMSSCGAVLLVSLLVACGGGGGSKSPTTPTPPPPAPPPENWSITGRVVAYGTGVPVSGARVIPSVGAATNADADGNFRISSTLQPPSPFRVTVSADGYLEREVYARYEAGARDGFTVDMIRNAAPFSYDFYKALVRGSFDDEDPAEVPVLKLPESPKFYVRTYDQNGRAVEREVLNVVLPAIRKAVSDWTGGRLAVTTLETGRQTRPRTEGWIMVNITRNYKAEYCGQAYLGSTQGEIELVNDRCHCGSNKISGAIVAHEVGHALGFFHVGDRNAVMYPYAPGDCPPGTLSANERYHASLAYARPRFNMDPDTDPPDSALLMPGATGGRDILIKN
jgi:Carboxypeptidase regulatory-like domain/Matrixin